MIGSVVILRRLVREQCRHWPLTGPLTRCRTHTGLGAAIALINARVYEWVGGWTVVLGIVLLMFSPALVAAAAAVLSKMSTVEKGRLLVPYIWFGVGGCAALGLLALIPGRQRH